MRLFSEKVNPTFNSSGYNILTVKDYTEVFFDVYEFEINGSRFVAEKTGELDDAPIISIPVDYNNIVENYDFVLHKGEQSIHFDPSTQSTPSQIKSVPDVEPLLTESVEEETDEVFLEEKKSAILEEIEKAKIAAAKYIKSIEKQNKRELVSYQTEREIALKEDIEKQKKILLDEFYSFVDQLKDRIAEESSDTALELKDIISEQLTSVSKDIDTRLSSAEKAIDTKLEERANELLNDVLLSEVKRSGKEIADDLNSQVKTIAENISKSLTSTRKQIEVDINEKLQEISTELNAKDKAIVELNDTLTKQSNRALSRIGTVKTQLESTVQDVVNSLEARIETASDRLEKYYAEKLQLVESSMTNVSEETKKHIIGLIKESHQSLQADIANIKVTVPNIVIEKSNGNQEIDVGALRTELEKSVSNRFVNEISSLKRLIELSSGGGSVAMQFAGGGTMNGNLTVVGTISASQYLGIPGGSATGAYLPLSGGTVTGDVSVSGLLSANRIGFNTGAGLTAGTGQLTWNNTNGTLELGLKGGAVRTEIGQGLVTRVVNKTTPNVDLLGANYQVVVISGATGERLSVKLAQADNDANSAGTLGLVAENIPKNQEGFIITVGLLKDIDTTGSLQGETWNDGDILYLSPTLAGGITNIKPQAPQHTVIIGYVEYAHQNHGKIYVKIDNGYEIDELHNVRITSVSANDVLKYNSTSRVWENSNTLSLSSLSASRIYTTQLDALSANITVIDIKQYELSGFNVTGDVTINGSVSSQNISAGDIYTNGVPVATAVDPVRTTLSGNGVLSTFAISGAANLINPSALIVAIDGALQEPSADYLVNNGQITFTSPLPSGSKAVVISPTNALIAGQVVPSDGSVTSAKIAGGVTISEPTLIDPVIDNGLVSSTINNQVFVPTDLALVASLHSRSFSTSPPISFFHDFDVTSPFTLINIGTAGTGLADSDNFGALGYGIQRITTGASSGSVRGMFARISGTLGAQIGMRFRACFAIEDPTSCEVMIGLGWVHQQLWGIAYRAGQNGDAFTFIQNQTFILDSGTYVALQNSVVPQAGNFLSGKRYIADVTAITSRSVRVIIMEADWNVNNWTVLNDNVVSLSQDYLGGGRHGPCARVTTRTSTARSLWFDWFATEHLTAER